MDETIAERFRTSLYFRKKWSKHLKRVSTACGDTRTLTVIAKYPEDGLYYLGKIEKQGDRMRVLFPFNDGVNQSPISKNVNRDDVITYAGAAPWPNLQLDDHVLIKVACQGVPLISYFPGTIIALPNEKDWLCEQVYRVKMYTDKTVAKKRRDIVKITSGQFTKMTKELIRKHHHKPDPEPAPELAPGSEAKVFLQPRLISVNEGSVNLRPSKGDEVLARWQDDGWYYYGLVVFVPKPGTKDGSQKYGVMDSTGQTEKIEEKYLFSDRKRDHFMPNITEGAYVIAEHPSFPYSYAPGQVTHISTTHTATLNFYDGATKVTNLSYIYMTTKTLYEEDVSYIKTRMMKENVKVLAREAKTGGYLTGSIIHAEDKNHIVKVKFDRNGEEVFQSVKQVIPLSTQNASTKRRQSKDYHYVWLRRTITRHMYHISLLKLRDISHMIFWKLNYVIKQGKL